MSIDRICIQILHSDTITRTGLSVALARFDDFAIVEPIDGAPSPLSSQPSPLVDVTVADLACGAAITEGARQRGVRRTPRVMVLADTAREWEIRGALERGVQGYMLLTTPLDEIARGIRQVHRGARHLGASIAERLAESLSVEALTTREEDVLRLVAEGLCNKAIGRRLEIAVGTVKSHLKSTFGKLKVTSRTQAVIAAERRGLLCELGEEAERRHDQSMPTLHRPMFAEAR